MLLFCLKIFFTFFIYFFINLLLKKHFKRIDKHDNLLKGLGKCKNPETKAEKKRETTWKRGWVRCCFLSVCRESDIWRLRPPGIMHGDAVSHHVSSEPSALLGVRSVHLPAVANTFTANEVWQTITMTSPWPFSGAHRDWPDDVTSVKVCGAQSHATAIYLDWTEPCAFPIDVRS